MTITDVRSKKKCDYCLGLGRMTTLPFVECRKCDGKGVLKGRGITKDDIERIYKKYIVPDNPSVPGILVVAINHPISAMRAELLEILERDAP